MGLFGFGKKKPEKAVPSPEEIQRRWSEAYRANPQMYQKDGALMGACTLTEGVETLLPLHPESMWGVDGKPIQDWRLCLVSVTEQRIIGQMAYSTAMERLRPYSLAASEDWILIRAANRAEMDKLLEGLPQQVG